MYVTATKAGPTRLLDRELRRTLLGIFTATGTKGDGEGVERFLPPERTTLCGYGRQALAIALYRVGIGAGDLVLLPGFICRDLLGAVRTVGADVRFYDIDEQFRILVESLDRADGSRIRAVVAVNYFGFSQPLNEVSAWCRARGAVLIEDNAHGFLSADGDVPLGRRADFGIFSLRKTLAIPNGAALVDNRSGAIPTGGDAPRFAGSSLRTEVAWGAKRAIKRAMALGGLSAVRPLIGSIRRLRRLTTGSDVEVTPPYAEDAIPQQALAARTPGLLRRVAVREESTRRRSLYRQCQTMLESSAEIRPLFSELPGQVVPQGFPFLYLGEAPGHFADDWWRRGIPMSRWPDLPHAVAPDAPPHYHRVMLVPFLW